MGNANPKLHKAKRGLNLPILGAPASGEVKSGQSISKVALMASDYIGMKPSMKVKAGEDVKRGQVLFEDRKNPGVLFTSPGCGTVEAVNRGERRALHSVVIQLSSDDGNGDQNEVAYSSYKNSDSGAMTSQDVRNLLIESGMWTAFRTRPFSKIPSVGSNPRSIFVTAMDTNPLAPSVKDAISGQESLFEAGLDAISILADGKPVHLCKSASEQFPAFKVDKITIHDFSGKHPVGTPGYHIHCIDPVNRERTVWYIGYQDVIAIGGLVKTGKLHLERVISLAGPSVKEPRLIRTRVGANINSLIEDQIMDGDVCVLSGSVFNGRQAAGEEMGYLGRYHNQITALANDRTRRFLGWLSPGFNRFSVTRLFGSTITPGKKFDFTTDRNGGIRTMIPFGTYEKVMPFEIMAPFLLRAILAKDLESAEQLGCLELDEEDLALCTFVCPSKNEYGPALRDVLTQIEKEG